MAENKDLLMAVDIGNSTTSIGIFGGDKLKVSWYIATDVRRMADEYSVTLLGLLKQQGISVEDVKKVALLSVVPPLVVVFKEMFERYFRVSPLVVEAGIKTGVRIKMDNPREVGADRIANAAAAHLLYSGAVIVVDLGTATTFDTISAEGDYLGGAIAPGIDTAAEAMFQRAAMLPRIELARPGKVIGTSTTGAMQSGFLYGYVDLVDGLVSRIKKELGQSAKVVATGGYADLIAAESKLIDRVNKDLTLIGLRLIYIMNRA